MQSTLTKTQDEFRSLAEQTIADAIKASIATRGACTIGLAGGSTPGPIYTALGKRRDIDWHAVTIILIDERYVSHDHPDSNYGMLARTIRAVDMPARAARFMGPDTSLPLDECVSVFATALAHYTLDIVVLGMGDDGHIASLFPPLPTEAFGPARAIHTTTERFAVFDRISVSMSLLQEAKQKVLLITGKTKKEVIEQVRMGNGQDLPISKIADETLQVIATL